MPEAEATVFVVDDDLGVREAVAGLVRSAGLDVQVFPSAQEVLARAPKDVHLRTTRGAVVRWETRPGYADDRRGHAKAASRNVLGSALDAARKLLK